MKSYFSNIERPIRKCFILFVLLSVQSYSVSQSKLKSIKSWETKAKRYGEDKAYDSAIYYHELLANLYKKRINLAKYVQNLNKIGENYLYKGDLEKALHVLEEGLSIGLEFLGERDLILAQTYNNLGWYYEKSNDNESAISYFMKALFIREQVLPKNSLKIAQSYNNIAGCYGNSENYEEALSFYNNALKIRRQWPDNRHSHLDQTYNDMGWLYGRMKDRKNQLYYFEKSLALRLKFFGEKNLDVAKSYNNLSLVYYLDGRLDKTFDYLNQSLQIKLQVLGEKSPQVSLAYRNMARIYYKNKEFERALYYFQKAIIASSIGFNLMANYPNPEMKQVFAKSAFLDLVHQKAKVHQKIYEEKGRIHHLEEALSNYSLALELIDTMRFELTSQDAKRHFNSNVKAIFEGGIAVAFLLFESTSKIDFLHQAFAFSEKSKAFLVLEHLQDVDAKKFSSIPLSLVQQENNLKKEIAHYKKVLFVAKNQRDSAKITWSHNQLFNSKRKFDFLVNQLERDYPNYFELKYNYQVVTIAEIQNQLDENTVFISYFVGENTFKSFVITRNDFKAYKLTDSTLRLQIMNMISLVNSNKKETFLRSVWIKYNQLAHQIYAKLLAKQLDDFPIQKKQLFVSPDGVLNSLPFELLLTDIDTTAQFNYYKNLPYLIRQYAISYHYSATLFLKNEYVISKAENKNCLAMAPYYSEESSTGTFREIRNKKLVYLPGAINEIENIAKVMEGKFIIGKAATENNFKKEVQSQYYGIIHLAMHGLSNHSNPMYSMLFFADSFDQVEDDTLYTYELYNMHFNADLVVLSACETGAGKNIKGEGIMSLARGFMYSGIPSILQTHWNVGDEESTELMTYFYEFISGNMPKDQALQQAKLKYLNEHEGEQLHPFLWGGFILNGCNAPITIQKSKQMQFSYMVFGFLAILIILFGWVYLKKYR